MINRIIPWAGAVLMAGGTMLAQPPQATRGPQAAQPAQQRSSEEEQTTPEAQRPQFPGGQQRQQMPREQSPQPGEPGEGGGGRRGGVAPEQSVITHHTARIGGQTVTYTANAATYIIRDDSGTPKATMFFVAYTKDGVDPKTRPVSFVYNGGPGSASLFTHMGFGPKRPVLAPDGHSLGAAPYSYTDNEDSFLDATDLVFIDAIGTGFSRPAPGENRAQFYGIIEDANWFADFIYDWVTRNGRWASPKFLLGES
ncbi:MAG TPA: hypothetical protein VE998_01635, partial [Terriglobales bacterium]|nr:hypothetical protein [Terriglobales bacterium]